LQWAYGTAGVSNGTTPRGGTDDDILIATAGDYAINFSGVIDASFGLTATVDIEIKKNNGATALTGCKTSAAFTLATERGRSISGIATLAANDTVEIWITSDVTRDFALRDVSLSVVKVG
jgi:hypothetical protein